ncbi:hypothetical protein, partial [Pseudomonas lactis]|uniref:hypothetical protein n=1 Tax=Pseudomonas lactis TaxID=1615674 RepID=UPI0028A0A806
RGCDSGVSGAEEVDCAAAIAASLGLDSSHILSGVVVGSCVWRDGPAKRYSTYTADPLWELSSFSEAAKAVGQAMKMLIVPPPSQPRWGSTAPTF